MNGNIRINDATTVKKYLAGNITFNNLQYYLADYNNDGDVDVLDATAIQNYVANLDE